MGVAGVLLNFATTRFFSFFSFFWGGWIAEFL